MLVFKMATTQPFMLEWTYTCWCMVATTQFNSASGEINTYLLVSATWTVNCKIKTYLLVSAAWTVDSEINTHLLISQHGVSMVKSTRMYWFPQHGVSTFWLNQLIYIDFPTWSVNGEINTYLLVSATWSVNIW